MELSEVDDGTRVCYLQCSADPNFNQPIRIFHPQDRKIAIGSLSPSVLAAGSTSYLSLFRQLYGHIRYRADMPTE
jgi:hypothetical protein